MDSLIETQHWIDTSVDCGYLNPDQGREWLDRYALIGRMLNSMMTKADQFCSANKTDHRSPITETQALEL
jgi:hypothetical protein